MRFSSRAAWLGLVFVVTSPVAVCTLDWTAQDVAAQHMVQQARTRAGIPLSRASLYSAEELEPSQNGALVVKHKLGPYRALAMAPVELVTPVEARAVEQTLDRHHEILDEALQVARRKNFAIPPQSKLYTGSHTIIMRVAAGGKLLAVRAQLALVQGRESSALEDLATVAELCNRLNRIPTTSTGRIREDLVAGWLDTAAACAPTLTISGRKEVARLAQLIEPSNERRVLLGEASKQLQAARSTDFLRPRELRFAVGWFPWQAKAFLSRPTWSPVLASAWQQTLAEYQADPLDTGRFGRALLAFETRFPNTVNVLSMSESPSQAVQWLHLARRNALKRSMLQDALRALSLRRLPDRIDHVDVQSTRNGWKITQGKTDSTIASAALEWNGHDLAFTNF